jgi:predicted permease
VRARARERETAVREALGAGRSRLVRLWLAESALLAALGTALGVLLAWLGVVALKAAAPPGIPRLDAIAIDWPVLLTALVSSIVATVITATAPLRANLKGRRPGRGALVVAQCAGAVVLVILAVMLTRSFGRLSSFDLGWEARGVVSLKPEPTMPRTRARTYWLVNWSDRLLAQLEATPGIERAAITTSIPLSPGFVPAQVARAANVVNPDRRWSGVVHHVTDSYFEVMGLSLIEGRTFNAADRFTEARLTAGGPLDGTVAVVSQSVARTLWPGQPALGQIVRIPIGSKPPPLTVVGVVEDLQFHAVGEQPALHVFVPWTQAAIPGHYVIARVSGDPVSSLAVLRRVVEAVEPGTPVDQMTAMEALVSRATAQSRFTARTVAAFGLVALVLAAIGIYGTLSFLVGARIREIAIRLSLGASRGVIVPDVLKRGLAPVLAGGVIGIFIAAAIARAFEALLFQIEPLDAASYAGGALLLLIAALAAALAPARRILTVDPAVALRSE